MKFRTEQRDLGEKVRSAISGSREKLDDLWSNLRMNELYYRIQSYYSKTSSTFVFSGWLPANRQKELDGAIRKASGNRCYLEWTEASHADGVEKKQIPVKFSNPRILAMNNEESSISVGTTVPIPRIQRGSGGQGDMVTFEYKEINIQLNVTPHLGVDNEIIMYIAPIIKEITGWVEIGVQRAPITDKRSVNSIITVKNEETVVIGGLIKNHTKKVMKKVWLLGDIPLIGKLFQHEQYEK